VPGTLISRTLETDTVPNACNELTLNLQLQHLRLSVFSFFVGRRAQHPTKKLWLKH
jgi:hypothetical protein